MQHPELVELDTLADLVVAYPGPLRWRKGRIVKGGELIGTEPLLFGGGGGVVAVDVDDHCAVSRSSRARLISCSSRAPPVSW